MSLIRCDLQIVGRHPKNEFDPYPVACAVNTRICADRNFLVFPGSCGTLNYFMTLILSDLHGMLPGNRRLRKCSKRPQKTPKQCKKCPEIGQRGAGSLLESNKTRLFSVSRSHGLIDRLQSKVDRTSVKKETQMITRELLHPTSAFRPPLRWHDPSPATMGRPERRSNKSHYRWYARIGFCGSRILHGKARN
jgi:hypothetical protein